MAADDMILSNLRVEACAPQQADIEMHRSTFSLGHRLEGPLLGDGFSNGMPETAVVQSRTTTAQQDEHSRDE